MALSSTEKWVNGFVVDTSTGFLSLSMVTTGAKFDGGFLRDSDGRLVVTR